MTCYKKYTVTISKNLSLGTVYPYTSHECMYSGEKKNSIPYNNVLRWFGICRYQCELKYTIDKLLSYVEHFQTSHYLTKQYIFIIYFFKGREISKPLHCVVMSQMRVRASYNITLDFICSIKDKNIFL